MIENIPVFRVSVTIELRHSLLVVGYHEVFDIPEGIRETVHAGTFKLKLKKPLLGDSPLKFWYHLLTEKEYFSPS